MTRYVALLRGINVGGKNLIPMPRLKACFEAQGLVDVATYIQSGNVIFSADETAPALVPRIEQALSRTFGYQAAIVLRSRAQMAAVLAKAPRGFGTKPAEYRYDVMFLRDGLTAARVLEVLPMKEDVDAAHPGRGVVYFSRLESRAAQSRLGRVTSLPVYKQMTIRNWNTTTRISALLGAAV
jgi:uncharacterized protein (DUF1697 family)